MNDGKDEQFEKNYGQSLSDTEHSKEAERKGKLEGDRREEKCLVTENGVALYVTLAKIQGWDGE